VSVLVVSGSRSLPPALALSVRSVVVAAVAAGCRVSVGCAAGADSVAVSSVLAAGGGSLLSVFAVGGSCGSGFAGRLSAVAGVRSALAAGAAVSWWAGGSVAVPLRGRLAARSLACVRSAVGVPRSLVVGFVAAPPPRPFGGGAWPSCGSGSWSSLAAAARLGLPVFVFPAGGFPLPLLGAGAWSPVGAGSLCGSWRWVPVALF
jgi:hypothetical protein